MGLMKKVMLLEKLCVGVSCSAGGHEFNVNESIICIK